MNVALGGLMGPGKGRPVLWRALYGSPKASLRGLGQTCSWPVLFSLLNSFSELWTEVPLKALC